MAVPSKSPSSPDFDPIPTIQSAFPDLEITEGQWIEHTGQFNHLFLVNETIMVRFPRYGRTDSAAMAARLDILARLAPQLPLPIPVPLATDGPTDPPIYAYERLDGMPLWHHLLFKLNEANLKQVATTLAEFLKRLHQLPTHAYDLPIADDRSEWEEMYQNIRLFLYEEMRDDAKSEVSALFEGFLENAGLNRFTPAVRHGDFGSSNILYDPRTHELTGVLDFDSLALGDPAVDLASISTYGPLFSNEIFQAYAPPPDMFARIRFYRETFALQEALHGAMNDDPLAFEAGIADYR